MLIHYKIVCTHNLQTMNKLVNITKQILLPNKCYLRFANYVRCFHEDFSSREPLGDQKKKSPGNVATKYAVFRETDSTVILDIDEERQKIYEEIDQGKIKYDEYQNINLERGQAGVFEISDLVDVLQKESAEDIFVCMVPKTIKYVDYMCIVTGRSRRHIIAIAEFVRKVYKQKRNSNDYLPRIEGEKSNDWVALDLGNIALHIFSSEKRAIYDLESLWSIGPEFDRECNKPEQPLVDLYEKHSIYLSDLPPKSIVN